MRHFPRLVICLGLFVSISCAVAATELEFDHVWIVVTREAPERTALGKPELEIVHDLRALADRSALRCRSPKGKTIPMQLFEIDSPRKPQK
jgi:hypothetical protein